MLTFLQNARRDYQPSFDVIVVDIPEQTKMTLKADIKYKSNWQQGALKGACTTLRICSMLTTVQPSGGTSGYAL